MWTREERERVLQADLHHVWHPMTQHQALRDNPPKIIVKGYGSTVVDAEGNEYLDAMAGLWCVNVGYGRREIAEAVYRQMLELPYFPHSQANKPAAELAQQLARLAGGRLRHTYFVNSGSEANEAALKLARQYQRQVRPHEPRYKFISRYFAYHGTTLGALSLGAVPERKVKFEPVAGGFVHVPPCYPYRSPFGPGDDGMTAARLIEYAIVAEGPETVAAVVIEPIQSGIGVLVPPDGYLAAVAEACHRHGVLLIYDEVINGFGRTGKWFAHHHWGVGPDILCVAKGITSGYQPLGAVITTDEVFEAFLGEPGQGREALQVNTWGGHAAATAAALENLRIMEEEDLPGNAARVGAHLMNRLHEALGDVPIVGDIRGKGLLIGVELVEDRESKRPLSGARMSVVISECARRGLLVGRSSGTGAGLGNTVTLCPPLVLTEKEADRIAAVLGDVVRRV